MNMRELDVQVGTRLPLAAPVSNTIFVAFDTETTGLNPIGAKLVELCGVKFRGDGSEISTFQSLIDPQTTIPPEVTAIHGITDSMVRGMPTYDVVIPEFLSWATDPEQPQPGAGNEQTIFMAHNAPFDLSFLEVAMCKLGLPVPENLVIDTLPLSRQLVNDTANYQLRTLVEHLGLSSSVYHRALADSYHVRNLFITMLSRLPAEATVEMVVELAGKLHFCDRSQVDADSRWAEHPEMLRIKQAIETGIDLRISYSGLRKSVRTVTPRSVLFTGGTPYLSAFCHLAAAERTFRIDRIIKMETLEKQP